MLCMFQKVFQGRLQNRLAIVEAVCKQPLVRLFSSDQTNIAIFCKWLQTGAVAASLILLLPLIVSESFILEIHLINML